MNLIFPKRQILLFTIALFIFFGCAKEESCPERYDMGTFDLLASVKQKFPYKNSTRNFVFRDSLGNEVIASATQNLSTKWSSSGSQRECLFNPALNVSVVAKTGTIMAFVSIPELDFGFDVNFRVSPDFSSYENEYVHDHANIVFTGSSEKPGPFLNPYPQISIVLDERNDPEAHFTHPTPFFTILDREFPNVFSNTIGADKMKFYYNHELGIIGFKEMPNGTT